MTYKLTISGVDGLRYYTIQSPDAKEILEFIGRYDHSSSGIALAYYKSPDCHKNNVISYLYGEEVYHFLLKTKYGC